MSSFDASRAVPLLEAARAQDRVEGKREGLAEALIAMLDARGVAMDSADRERILNEHDLATLTRWIARAVTCADIAALFEEPAG
jgi:sugar diacid utilization regulator